ncbi:HipA domain-containing protein [Candidatus Sulfurimonas marisnigri]|uniref:HipA domain-containing protein n=1 Tax=Candidatus Sulfurimonas marisnigri TaxID=2740405 RepID=A0A7S7M2P2_9BACT|nr:HipA domain-containing protein [Candidatus Sulfurimonas marisnigri]QOY55159.1 HipA domain-containing protein [Candidatus Sulfurimonas marisnigri]
MKNDFLEVEAFIYGMKIGTLVIYEGLVHFEYDEMFLLKNIDISPLKLSLSDTQGTYINKDSIDIYKGLAGVFFDSLPDKHGMPFIDRYFEKKGFALKDVTILHKLTFIADRGLGAIEYRPKEHDNNFVVVNEIQNVKKLREDIRDTLGDKKEYTIDSLMNIIDSASPVGGARPKMLISFNPITNAIKYNNTSLEDGYIRSIIKFDELYPNEDGVDESIGLTKLEYVYMTMAKNCGINIATMHLHQRDNETHLILERFDRDANDNKIHKCSASGLLHKDITVAKVMSYEELFSFTNKVCAKQSSIIELYKRMIFNALSLNLDDHAKNFEFIMDRKGNWDLSPAFDITFSKGITKEHMTTINGKGIDFTIEDFLSIAKKNLISESDAMKIINVCSKELTSFKNIAESIGIESDEIENCEKEINFQAKLIRENQSLMQL